jgi:hypothetical protein
MTDGRYFTVRLKDTRLSYADGAIYKGFNDVPAAKLKIVCTFKLANGYIS